MSTYKMGDVVEIVHADGHRASKHNDIILGEWVIDHGKRAGLPGVRVGSRALVSGAAEDGRVVLALPLGWAAFPVANVSLFVEEVVADAQERGQVMTVSDEGKAAQDDYLAFVRSTAERMKAEDVRQNGTLALEDDWNPKD